MTVQNRNELTPQSTEILQPVPFFSLDAHSPLRVYCTYKPPPPPPAARATTSPREHVVLPLPQSPHRSAGVTLSLPRRRVRIKAKAQSQSQRQSQRQSRPRPRPRSPTPEEQAQIDLRETCSIWPLLSRDLRVGASGLSAGRCRTLKSTEFEVWGWLGFCRPHVTLLRVVGSGVGWW